MYVMPACYNVGDVIPFPFDTYDSNGGSVTITGLAVTDIEVYKNASTTQRSSDNGYTLADTDGIDFDGSAGFHGFTIDTGDNSDAGFWADGNTYWVHINAITCDGQTVRFTYLLALGYLLRPTTAGRKVDVSSGGEVGLDWANIGSPTTTVNLSGTTVKTASDVETDTQDIQSRLPAALGANGNIKADVRDYNGTAGTFSGGRPQVNTSHINGVAASSVTTVNANIGTTAPVNFTGAGLSALVRTDMVDIAGAAVSTSAAQIGVNAVNIGGTAQTPRDLGANIDATVSSRLATAGYTAPDNATISTINTNVSTLLSRITSTLFAGITSLGNWLRAMGRKGNTNATAVSELNADVGDGAGTYAATTDSQEAIRDRGDAAWGSAGSAPQVLVDTDVASVVDQTHLRLTAALGANDTYNNMTVVLYDASASNTPSVRKISDFVDANNEIVLDSAADFTVVAGDGVKIFVTPPGTTAPTAAQVADQVWDELEADHQSAGTMGRKMREIRQGTYGKEVNDLTARTRKYYDVDGTTLLLTQTASSSSDGKVITETPS